MAIKQLEFPEPKKPIMIMGYPVHFVTSEQYEKSCENHRLRRIAIGEMNEWREDGYKYEANRRMIQVLPELKGVLR